MAAAIRPNGKSLSGSQGKGLSLLAAKVSAILEAAEAFHAETIGLPLRLGTFEDLAAGLSMADPFAIPTGESGPFRPNVPQLWIAGQDIVGGGTRWVPFDVVHGDFTYDSRLGRGMFDTTSNGLAAGNTLGEAINHALCEVIERDASAGWVEQTVEEQAKQRVDLSTVDDPGCRQVLERFAAGGAHVAVWDTTSAVGVAAFSCIAMPDPYEELTAWPMAGSGMGCHPRREIALLRALTEAAQSRVTVIAGARDDVCPGDYVTMCDRRSLQASWERLQGQGERPLSLTPTFDSDTIEDDTEHILAGLIRVGVSQVVVVNLTHDDLGIPVARVVVPGLQAFISAAKYVPNQRVPSPIGSASRG